jgi:hypothetical protein
MNGKLIMPKQTAQKDAFFASLELYYSSYKRGEEWYNNNQFKQQIQISLPYLSQGAKDGPYLVKQSELTRYFGLVNYDYSKRPGRAQITHSGIRFYNAYLQNNLELQLKIIMEAIFKNSFGRNNTAILSSDSDIDPPKLFLKSIVDLNGISTNGLAYLLYVTHDLKIAYGDAIIELSKTNNKDREIPLNVSNKYSDVKFTSFLTSIGITHQIEGAYYLSDFVKENYFNEIKNMSIYNRPPDLLLTLSEDMGVEYDEMSLKTYPTTDIDQDRIISSFAYDIKTERFKKQNNRMPVLYREGNAFRYKTNARLSKTALVLANYKCRINNEHTTFISKLGKPYMEAHHLIPMMAQKDISINLDRIENIVSICPICHAAIHLGDTATRLDLLKSLYDMKKNELVSVGLNMSFGDLFSTYYA